MPVCFSLTRKNEKKLAVLQEIDTELWTHFEDAEPKDNDQWYHNWYNCIGLSLAMGKTFDECFDRDYSERMLEIILYLDEHYTADAWHEHKV